MSSEPKQTAIQNQSNRRAFLRTASAAGMSLPLISSASRPAASQNNRKRNMVFILIDDMRFDSMSCMDHPFLQTPNIDRLAHGGMRFEHGYVTTSLCSPSRASILSGQYPHTHGVLDNSTPLPSDTPTFPIELQRNGYKTAFVGKWHMGGSSDEPRPGFDHWVSFRGQGPYWNPTFNINGEQVEREGYMTDLLTDYAVDYLEEQDGEEPFFLYLSHKAVHAEFYPAERHKDAYSDVQIQFPDSMANTPENYEGKPLWVERQRQSWHGVDYLYHDQTNFEQFLLDYHRTMLAVDDSVGQVMDTLERKGMLDDTLIVFTSDNGFLHGEHGLIDKRCFYEPSVRVPVLAHCPNMIEPGQVSPRLVLNIDFCPTFLDAAGLELPETIQGASFLPLLQGKDVEWREAMLYEYFWERWFPQTPTVFGVRTERYKYMHYHGIFDLNELYDMQEDPDEMNNLIDSPAHLEVRQQMQEHLRELMNQYGATLTPSFKA